MSTELAVKALNQYRKRDIIPYLGLRYYLESYAGKNNRWINEVCTKLTIEAIEPSYLRTYHFKDVENGVFLHRDIYLPAPNEILSEVALISELSKHRSFKPKQYVFSYNFSSEREKSGVFQAYFDGFRVRHRSIAAACWRTEDGIVLYTDIKKFYPSIRAADALIAWERSCNNSELSERFRRLGREILKKHEIVSLRDSTGNGLLTGPLFSHVIANLLLDQIDTQMNEISNGNYWRYVDDVIFVGTNEEVVKWRAELENKLLELNLELHVGKKDFQVSCRDWLDGEDDFDNSFGIEWVSLIRDIKRFLLANPSRATTLQEVFKRNHIRIPIVDYSEAVKESTYLQKFHDWLRKFRWAKNSVKSINIEHLLVQAKYCEINLKSKLDELLNRERLASPYDEKRLTPKLRYLVGRLLYLLSEQELTQLYPKLEANSDLYFLAKIMEAVATRNVSKVLNMGVNAAHAAAQLLRVDREGIVVNRTNEDSIAFEQSLAVLEINDVEHECRSVETELIMLARAKKISTLMNSPDGFIKEIACLHGMLPPRHKETLDSSFDRDEELALDVLNQLQNSSSC